MARRQRQADFKAAVGMVAKAHRAAMVGDDLAHDGQAQA
jgi:hypothetical protein